MQKQSLKGEKHSFFPLQLAMNNTGDGKVGPGGPYTVPVDGTPVMAYPVSRPAYAATNNPYIQLTPVAESSKKGSMDTVTKLFGKCGRMVEDGTKKVTGTAGNIWYHLKTSPSLYDAAMTRLAQGTKVLAEGGYDKIFQHIFGIFPGEKLRKAYACYLSTSSGPVIGTLYISTIRLAFCSDNPLCLNSAMGPPEWVYYKVVVQLDQLRAVNPSANKRNPSEKYIQIVTADNHEFWFMGFMSYEKALHTLSEALRR